MKFLNSLHQANKTLIPLNTQHKFKILPTVNVEELQAKLENCISKNQYFTIKYDVNCKFYVEVFYKLEQVPSILSLLRALYQK